MKLFGHKLTATAAFGMAVVGLFIVISLFTPWIAPYSESANVGGTWDEPSVKMILAPTRSAATCSPA